MATIKSKLDSGQPIVLEDVHTEFEKYSFYIFTSSGVYDTSLYLKHDYKTDITMASNEAVSNNLKKVLIMGYNSTTPTTGVEDNPKITDRVAIIPQGIVQDIVIKGKKGHPFNGTPIK